jgi:hypothetical protein
MKVIFLTALTIRVSKGKRKFSWDELVCHREKTRLESRYSYWRTCSFHARSLPLGNLDSHFNAYTFHEDLNAFVMITLVSVVTKLPQFGTGASVAHTSQISVPATLLLSTAGHLELQPGVAFNDVTFI